MTAWLPAQRRAEAFEAALVGDAADPRFADLLEVVGALRESATTEPVLARSDYTADLRARLMAAADTELVPTDAKLLLPQRTTGTRRRQSRLSAAAAALVVVAGTAGIAAASGSALPGESLYPFKRGVEAAQASIAFTDAARGRDRLDQADARLSEIDRMVRGQGDTDELPATIQSFTDQAGDGADLLFRDFQDNGDVDSVTEVRSFASDAMARISDLSQDAPGALRPDLVDAASLLADLDQQASVLCGGCGARDTLRTPSALQPASAAKPLDVLLDVAPPAPAPAPDPGGSVAKGGATTGDPGGVPAGAGDLAEKVGGVVGGVVGGITGGSGTSGSGGTGTGSGTGSGSTVVDDPIGSLLGTLVKPSAAPTSGGDLIGDVTGTVGGLLGQ